MEYVIVICALICALVGVAGALLPALPGPPLSFAGLLLLLLCSDSGIGTSTIVVAGVFAAIITAIDYIAPVWLTKRGGGTTYGMWGAGIGMLAVLFMGPMGTIIGPFIGAFIGELIAKTPADKALATAFMSFVAFMLTTGVKLIYGIALLLIVCVDGWNILWG